MGEEVGKPIKTEDFKKMQQGPDRDTYEFTRKDGDRRGSNLFDGLARARFLNPMLFAPVLCPLLDRWYLAAGTALHVEGRKPHRPEVALTRVSLAAVLLDHFPAEAKIARDHLDLATKEMLVEALKDLAELRARVAAASLFACSGVLPFSTAFSASLARLLSMRAMELNAVAVEQNQTAFAWGRHCAAHGDAVQARAA